jgi:hypothetical protein
LFNQNTGPVVFPLNPVARRTKGAFMATMLAALLLLMFIGQAFGGQRMSCEAQPMRGGGAPRSARPSNLLVSGRADEAAQRALLGY